LNQLNSQVLKLSPDIEARLRDVVLGLYFDADDSLMKIPLMHPTDLAVSLLAFTGICQQF